MKVFVIQSLLALAQGAETTQQLGRLVNILAQKDDLISKFEDIGTRSGRLLMKENEDCIQKQNNSDTTGTNEVKEGLEEVSDMISGGLGMTGGYGPVKASIKSTWNFTDTTKKNFYAHFTAGHKRVTEKDISKKCWNSEDSDFTNFNEDVMNKITKNLKELNDLEYPGAGNENKWNLYWNHFRKFTESYGTHMVTKVYYGARVIRIVTEETAEKVDINEWKVETDIKVEPKIEGEDGNNGNLKVDKSYSKTKRNSEKKTEWCLKGIKPTDDEIEWEKIETGLKNLDITDRNTIIEEELTPIWLILEHHPDVRNYLSAIKNLANYIQGYSNDMPCKCSDVKRGEKGKCQQSKGRNYCYVKEINQWPGEENTFLPEVNKGQSLNGCSPTDYSGAKTYEDKGVQYILSNDPCKPRNQVGHKCWNHSMCEVQYYCTDDEDKDMTCQPRKSEGERCGGDERKCEEGMICKKKWAASITAPYARRCRYP